MDLARHSTSTWEGLGSGCDQDIQGK